MTADDSCHPVPSTCETMMKTYVDKEISDNQCINCPNKSPDQKSDGYGLVVMIIKAAHVALPPLSGHKVLILILVLNQQSLSGGLMDGPGLV